MDDVMSQLSQGLNVTSGLKKVTSDMKTKNRSDRSGKVEVKQPVNKKKTREKWSTTNNTKRRTMGC